jgi:hypothetical protein
VSTIGKLAEMTDQAAFERLATAILREAEVQYASLLHPGVNRDGKTVKAPVDGIGFVLGANPAHMIVVHHTTCKRDDLGKKWLHNPATVKARKGGRPPAPPGDFIKSLEIIRQERTTDPSLQTTLVLTTNQEPPEDLVRQVHAFGKTEGIEIDIWSASRLGHFLDNVPTGQWLRREYLGTEQERLSPELLKRLSEDSLHANVPAKDEQAWVSTMLDDKIDEALLEQDTIFVLAESGLGKSVACHKQLSKHIAAGRYGLVLTHSVVSTSPTIEHAVEATLLQLSPGLASGSGSDALAFCSQESVMFLVVEDINKSGQAAALAEKIASWDVSITNTLNAASSTHSTSRQRWKLLCPIWPQVVASINDVSRKIIQRAAVSSGPLTTREGGEAVRRRASLRGLSLSVLDAEIISQTLGNDPLLIALHEPDDPPRAERVIGQFIDASVGRVAAQRGQYTASDYRTTLRRVAQGMLESRDLNPTWEALLSWFSTQTDSATMLRHLVHHGEVIHLSGNPANETLNFRHDRVRDVLLADAVAYELRKGDLSDDLLSEPYFAEVIGAALLLGNIHCSIVDQVRRHNPLALFGAFRLFREPSRELEHAILRAIQLWLEDGETHTQKHQNLRWNALAALSRTESSRVVGLVRKFNEQGWTVWEALLRNGDLSGALNLCIRLEPGLGARWRDSQVEHAKLHFGARFGREIGELLRSPNTPDDVRAGALRLAGYLSYPELAHPIEKSWNGDLGRIGKLADYMWAAAQCCASDPSRYMKPLCDAWAALPGETENNKPSDRDSFAADHLKWAFRDNIPTAAISYFVERAKDDDALRWPITYMLHGLDHPTAVEFVVREIADKTRQLEGTGSFSPFAISATDDWIRQQEEGGRPMSPESRNRLLALWQDSANDEHLREQSLRFWGATKTATDLEFLRLIVPSDVIADTALRQRLERGDHSAVPRLCEKLAPSFQHRQYWWQFVYPVWCATLMVALKRELEHRRQTVERSWNPTHPTDFVTYKVIMELPQSQAEGLLLEHWDHLRFEAEFVQAALYVATPALLQKVAEVVASCPEPKKMFQYIDSHYGIKTKGRSGVTSPKQLESLGKYLSYLDKHVVYSFWELCNDKGWFDLRRRLLDPYVDRKYHTVYLEDSRLRESLDEMVDKNRERWLDHWIEDVLKTGISSENLLSVVHAWLSVRPTEAALKLAAQAVVQIGRRKDLQILDQEIEPRAKIAEIVVDTTFALKRRRLV